MNDTEKALADPACTTFGFLRHGQTEWNRLKKIQGSRNSPLTESGREQVSLWAPTLQQFPWHRVLASDLGRVQETVGIINSSLGIPVTYDQRLREQSWGDWEGLTIPYIRENLTEDLARRVDMGWEFSAPDGETRTAVKNRVAEALFDADTNWPGQNILIVCHQGVIKATLYHLTGRQFLPGEDPLLQHNSLHIISCRDQHLSPLQLNINKTIAT